MGITDSRVHIIKRTEPVPASINGRTALNYGDGKYRLICLDKDLILEECLDRFIEQLKLYGNVSCGYCILNSKNEKGVMTVQKREIEKAMYLGAHPSGFFYRSDAVETDSKSIDVWDKDSIYYDNPFGQDFIYAQGLILGQEAVYEGKLIQTETQDKAKKTKSFTYSRERQNLYFMPECRKKQCIIYLEHLKTLHLGKEREMKVVAEVCKRTLVDCTWVFRNILKNEAICEHYGIECRMLSLKELRKEERMFWNFYDTLNLEGLNDSQKKFIKNSVKGSMVMVYVKHIIKIIIRREHI
jgi:hypothetical protein